MKKLEGMQLKRVQTLIIFGLVLVNGFLFYGLMNKLYIRLDFTAGSKYSISKPTVDLIRKLENKLIINYYYERRTKEVPGLSQVIQYVDDMLQEYESNSKGMIDYKLNELSFENPNDREKIDEIEKLGVNTVSLSQNDGAQAKNTLGFSGIVLEYMGKSATIGTLFNDAKFEYNLDVEINKLIGAKSTEKIGILVASPDKSLEQHYKYLNQFIRNEYENAEVIYDAGTIPAEVTTLLVLGGDTLTEYQVYKLDQFIMSGGNVVAAVNGVKLNLNNQYGGPQAYPSTNPLIAMFSSYGITINNDLVGDNLSYNPVAQRGQLFVERMRYPMWVKVATENINRKNPIVEDFAGVNMFWPSSITIADKIKEKAEVLFTTTKDAWVQKDQFKVDLDTFKYPVQEATGQYTLGVSYQGDVESHFTGKTIPVKEGSTESEGFIASGKSKMVVFSNEDFLMNDFVNREDELYLVLNALDYMTKDGALIEIRNKSKFTRPLNKVLNQSMFNAYKTMIIGITTYLIPVIFIITGIMVAVARKKKYRLIEAKFTVSQPEKEGE